MCREQKISIPRPFTHGASHDEADIHEPDIADVVRANLLRLMQARGLSLQGLAAIAGVSPAALEDVAAGRSFPSLGLLWKLARALDLPCTVFIEEPLLPSCRARPKTPRRLPEGLRIHLPGAIPRAIWRRARPRALSFCRRQGLEPSSWHLADPFQEAHAVDLERRGEPADQTNAG
jgi:transcriptional regulator with XRE-family HTH domain